MAKVAKFAFARNQSITVEASTISSRGNEVFTMDKGKLWIGRPTRVLMALNNNARSGSCIWYGGLIIEDMVKRRQVLKGFNNRKPWEPRCSKVAIRIHLPTEYMKHKITYGLAQ